MSYAILKLKEVPESCIDCPCEYDSICCQALGYPDGDFVEAKEDVWKERLFNCPLEICE